MKERAGRARERWTIRRGDVEREGKRLLMLLLLLMLVLLFKQI